MTVIGLPDKRPDPAALSLAFESPEAEGIAALLEAGDAFSARLYPAESNHAPSIEEMRRLDLRFLVVRAAGEAVACVALVDRGGYGEIKRMWVEPAARKMGIAQRMLAALERAAIADGYGLLRLETGVYQPEAVRLYTLAGFVERAHFADYAPDPLSIFMEKRLPGFEPEDGDEDLNGDGVGGRDGGRDGDGGSASAST